MMTFVRSRFSFKMTLTAPAAFKDAASSASCGISLPLMTSTAIASPFRLTRTTMCRTSPVCVSSTYGSTRKRFIHPSTRRQISSAGGMAFGHCAIGIISWLRGAKKPATGSSTVPPTGSAVLLR